MKYNNITTIILLSVGIAFTLCLVFTPAALGISERGTAYEMYFDSEKITVVNITISEEDWADILENPLEEEYHIADVEINGDSYSGVGIRTKGMSSLSSVASSDSDRYSFKIQADEYVSGQSFAGLTEFVLNNNFQDASSMREFLSYELMEELGVPTPLHAYATVYLNGEYWGLYLMVEALEEDFALRNFGADYGKLYKPGAKGGAMGGSGLPMGGGIDAEFRGDFEMPDGNIPGGDEMMAKFQGGFGMPDGNIPRGGEMGAGFQGGFGMPDGDFKQGIRTEEQMPNMGVGGFGDNTVGGGADLVYTGGNISNYSQIFDNAVFDGVKSTDKLRVITALKALGDGENLEEYVDVDSVLRYFAANTAVVNLDSYVGSSKHNYYLYEKDGVISILPWDYNLAFGKFQGGDAKSVINFPIDTPVASGIALSERPLIGALLEVDAYKEQYHTYLKYIAEEFFGESFCKRIDSIDSLICKYVETDPTAFFTYEEYKEDIETLKTYGELRAESILGQINGTIPSTHEGQKNSTMLVNADSIRLTGMGSMFGGGKQ